jgi:hypothetical protein
LLAVGLPQCLDAPIVERVEKKPKKPCGQLVERRTLSALVVEDDWWWCHMTFERKAMSMMGNQ